jgi:hypothetical protein
MADHAASPSMQRIVHPGVYLTLGTICNLKSGDLFDRAIAGIRSPAA